MTGGRGVQEVRVGGVLLTEAGSLRGARTVDKVLIEHDARERRRHLSGGLLLVLRRQNDEKKADGRRAFTAEVGGRGEANERHDWPREKVNVRHLLDGDMQRT